MSLLRKTVRLSTLGLIGDSPKNQQRKAEAKHARAQAQLAKAETQRVAAETVAMQRRAQEPPPPSVGGPQSPIFGQAAWLPDPAGRCDARWWDGRAWTADVTVAGVQARDPLD